MIKKYEKVYINMDYYFCAIIVKLSVSLKENNFDKFYQLNVNFKQSNK